MSTAAPVRIAAALGALIDLALAPLDAQAQSTVLNHAERKAMECGSVVVVRCAESPKRDSGDPFSIAIAGVGKDLERLRSSDDGWSLDRIVIEGARTRPPTIQQIFTNNLGLAPQAVSFKTVDVGGGIRCTTVVPYNYRVCSKPIDISPKALDGPWR